MFKLLILLAGLVAAGVAIHGLGMVLGFRLLRLSHPDHGGHHDSPVEAISSYASVVVRLGEFVEHAESCPESAKSDTGEQR